MVAGMTDLFGESGVPSSTWRPTRTSSARRCLPRWRRLFADFGLTLDSLVVQNVSLPEELQKILDQKIGMNMIGDMGRFTQYQVANAIPEAARNEGGMAGMGVGLGAGVGFGQVMGQAMASAMQPAAGGAPRRHASAGWLAPVFGRRGRRDAGKTARAGRKGHPQPGRIRRQESGIAQETELTATTWR
jgi:membrane protease subunit (stomatin/prohibitin family)